MERMLAGEPREPFHKRHRDWLIGWGLGITAVILFLARPGDSPSESQPDRPTTSDDRAPYAEVACEGFTRDAGSRTDDGETSLVTPNLADGDIYTVQMYENDVRRDVRRASHRPGRVDACQRSGP